MLKKELALLSDIKDQVDRLEKEILEVYKTLVLPTWGKEMHGFPQTLYGYMMEVFSFIDLLSAHWKGNERNQTQRMISFMNTYICKTNEANSVLVQVWRHKLMHTARPRALKNKETGKDYYWLLHWHEHLPNNHHLTFNETSNRRILNIGLVYLVKDLELAIDKFSEDIAQSQELSNNFVRHTKSLESYEYREITT